MIKITNQDWKTIQTYATLIQMATLDQHQKDTHNDANVIVKMASGTKAKHYRDGRIPMPDNLMNNTWRVLPELFQKINRNNHSKTDNYGLKLFSKKLKHYLKPKNQNEH